MLGHDDDNHAGGAAPEGAETPTEPAVAPTPTPDPLPASPDAAPAEASAAVDASRQTEASPSIEAGPDADPPPVADTSTEGDTDEDGDEGDGDDEDGGASEAFAEASAEAFAEASADGSRTGRKRRRRKKKRRKGDRPVEAAAPEAAAAPAPTPAAPTPPPPPREREERPKVNADLTEPLGRALGLDRDLTRRASAAGLETLGDLLFTLPTRYHDRRHLATSASVLPGEEATLAGVLVERSMRLHQAGGQEERLVFLKLQDDHGIFRLAWAFESPRPKLDDLELGATYLAWGRVIEYNGDPLLVEPELERQPAGSPTIHRAGIIPVYTDRGDIPGLLLREWVLQGLRLVSGRLRNIVPDLKLSLEEALWEAHFPRDDADLVALAERRSEAFDVLVRSELFLFALALGLRRELEASEGAAPSTIRHTRAAKFLRLLGSPLTDDQAAAFEDVKRDLMSGRPMSRLLQADIGAGKTVVAMLAALMVIEGQHQVAFVVPNDNIAERRHRAVSKILEKMGVRVEVMSAAVRGRRRDRLLTRLRKGEIDILIGTQAMFQEAVPFRRLGMVIVEEQHFNGIQRRMPTRRGHKPHLLVMTSNPAPTALAVLQYGDLTVSRLSQRPAERAYVETHVYTDTERAEAYQVFSQVLAGRKKGFILHSRGLREEGMRRIATSLEAAGFGPEEFAVLPEAALSEERAATIASFQGHRLKLLILPLGDEDVVETDDVSGLLVDGAEGCALGYLNRLRVRAEMGPSDGGCVFIAGGPTATEEAKRMRRLEETTDGFVLADEDLRQRGLQAFLGGKRPNLPEFRVAELIRHSDTLAEVLRAAEAWESKNSGWLKNAVHVHLASLVKQRWAEVVKPR